MPALRNPRHEAFVQLWKRGVPPIRAYPMAGYKAHPANCYRVSGNESVKRRFAELTRSLAVKTRVTVESITEDLTRIAIGAEANLQFGAAKSAIETKAKLHGLLIDRKETGSPGEFSSLTADQVLDQVRKDHGDEAAKALAVLLATTAQTELEATEAKPVDIPPPASGALN